MLIRDYSANDEKGWLRCRVLSFLDTAYYDNVLREKEKYDNPSIELVAEEDGQIAGLMDLELDTERDRICYDQKIRSAMIWHIAVHPERRRRGIAHNLLAEAERRARAAGIERLEAWTRDDEKVRQWYLNNGFHPGYSYLHVFIEGKEELRGAVKSEMKGLTVISSFAHYTGPARQEMRRKFSRVHECIMYEKCLTEEAPGGSGGGRA